MSWKKVLGELHGGFLSPGSLEHQQAAYGRLQTKVQRQLFSGGTDRPALLGNGIRTSEELEQLYHQGKHAKIGQDVAGLDSVMDDILGLFQGLGDWNHPLCMPNVIASPNLAASMSVMLGNIFNPNLIHGDVCWGVANSEIETSAMLADLFGWDQDRAGGIFTFGGSGCYLYGLKYALTQVFGKASRHKGIRADGKLLVSSHGHYCKLNSTDWCGLGMDNVININVNPRTYNMDIGHLEETLERLSHDGIPVVAIVCTMCSTDSFAVDSVKTIRKLMDRYPNPSGFGRPLLYCDAVIGWSWLFFRDYDFVGNPLQFSDDVLPIIESNFNILKEICYADAVGCDFHKTGWSPYNSSVFMVRDHERFCRMMGRPGSEYLQERTSYNPGLYTLEVSRSSAYSLAAWATLKYFGSRGFQAMLGGVLENKEKLRKKLDSKGDELVCVGTGNHGFVTLMRVYPEGVDGDVQYIKERDYPDCIEDLMKHNRLQEKIADKLWEWYRSGKKIKIRSGLKGEERDSYAPFISYTSGFRPANYNHDLQNPDAMVYALKAFPMNFNIDDDSYDILIGMIRRARDEVIEQGWL